MKRVLTFVPLALLAGCSLTSDSLREVVAREVASGNMTPEAGEAVLAATSGTVGHYFELAVTSVLGAAGAYFGINLRRGPAQRVINLQAAAERKKLAKAPRDSAPGA